jgi:hypothetical protein
MKHFDILSGLILPPTQALFAAIESGLLAMDAAHVSPDTATALIQHLCANAQWTNSSSSSKAGIDIFKRLMALGGNPWGRVLADLPNAATAAMSNLWEGAVMLSLPSCPVPIDSLEDVSFARLPAVSWLQLSVSQGLHVTTKALLDSGASLTHQFADQTPVLHLARDPAMVKLLLNHGAEVGALGRDGYLCAQHWDIENCVDYIHMLVQVMDKAPGLDRINLLEIAGRGPRASKPLIEDIKNPRKDIFDSQGRSIFFRMAARTLNRRGQDKGSSIKQVLMLTKEMLGWLNPSSNDPLDKSAARLLLWSTHKLSKEYVDINTQRQILQMGLDCGPALMDASNTGKIIEDALLCLDAMVEAGLLEDPSEIAATALGGLWAATGDRNALMTQLMDPGHGYLALQWLERCFQGVKGGSWCQGKSKLGRWVNPDVPIEDFCDSFVSFVIEAHSDHSMWSNPDTVRALVQVVRSNWPRTEAAYYALELAPLDSSWLSRLEKQYANAFNWFHPATLRAAVKDDVCSATLIAMEKGNGPLQKLRAELNYAATDDATPQAKPRTSTGPRL